MEAIIGGNAPKDRSTNYRSHFKPIVNWSQVNLPKFNPRQFELCRNLDGMAKWEFAKRAKLTTKRYNDIENGNVAPTDDEVNAILQSQTHVVIGFFQQWPETEPDFSFHPARTAAINYYKYKIFRDINKPQSMSAV